MLVLHAQPLDLELAKPFGLSRGSRRWARNLLVSVTGEGATGFGEGAPQPRYGESRDALVQQLAAVGSIPGSSRQTPEQLLALVPPDIVGAARAAVDLALHDWLGKVSGQRVAELLALPGGPLPPTSFTIGLDTPQVMADGAAHAAGRFAALKIKLGRDDDREIIEAIRRVTDVPLRIDANEGWPDRELAAARLEWLGRRGVELVEQPLPAGRLDDVGWLRARSALPLVADEDLAGTARPRDLVGAYHGVNIKLDKCGGLRAARLLIDEARDADLQVMLGCMVASSLAITGAAQLATLADWVDLDGHLLLAADPHVGVSLSGGRLRLPQGPGLGVHPQLPH